MADPINNKLRSYCHWPQYVVLQGSVLGPMFLYPYELFGKIP